jgi:uncharacterized membrane protein YbhN (UPF0104 family)
MNYSYLYNPSILAIGIISICILVIVFYIYSKNREGKETISDNQLKIVFILALAFGLYYFFIYDSKPKLVQNMFLTVVNTGSDINLSAIPSSFFIFLFAVVIIYFGYRHVTKRLAILAK